MNLYWRSQGHKTVKMERSSSSAFPSYISGVHHLGWHFCTCDLFSPTIKVVTFRLHGWCIQGVRVFLLPAFTCLGHKWQEPLSLCDGMHVCTDWTSVYILMWKSFWGMVSEPMLTPREKFPLWEKSPRRRIEPTMLYHAGQRAQHTTNKLFQPPEGFFFLLFFYFSHKLVDRPGWVWIRCCYESGAHFLSLIFYSREEMQNYVRSWLQTSWEFAVHAKTVCLHLSCRTQVGERVGRWVPRLQTCR